MKARFLFLFFALAASANLLAQGSTFKFQASAYSVNETDSVFFVVVERVGSAGTASVDCRTQDLDILNPAEAGFDYTATNTTFTWADGDTTPRNLIISMIDDGDLEGPEAFGVVLENPGAGILGTPSQTVVTIVDDEVAGSEAAFQSAIYQANEGSNLTIAVERTGDLSVFASVDVSTVDIGDATSGVDFSPISETLNFGVGQGGPLLVDIPILSDAQSEPDEAFEVHLSNPLAPMGLGSINVTEVTILANTFVPGEIQFVSATYAESETAPGLAVQVERVNGVDGAASVDFTTVIATQALPFNPATPGVDYTDTVITINFASGVGGVQTVTVPLIDDAIFEGTEEFPLFLENPVGASLGSLSSATGQILDDELPPVGEIRFFANLFSADESAGNMEVKVERVNGSAGAVSVMVTSQDLSPGPGSAIQGKDYNSINQLVNFADGETGFKVLMIPIVDDMEVEGDEDFEVSLNTPSGGVGIGSPALATARIIDNDFPQPGELSFAQTVQTVGEGDGSIMVEILRQGGSDGAVGATFSTFPIASGASPGDDYTPVTTTVSWADGDTASKFVSVVIQDDLIVESDEDFGLDLTDPTGGASIGTPFQSVARIIDNDVEPPGEFRFSQSSYNVNENGGNAVLTIERVNGSGGPVSVVFETASPTDIEATPGVDYQPVMTTINFADGDVTPKTANIPILDDSDFEGNETFQTRLVSPTGGASIGTPGTAEVVIVDDELPQHGIIQLSASSYNVVEGELVATVQVVRVDGTDGDVGVVFGTAPIAGGATPELDYQPTFTKLFFADGQAGPIPVSIPIIDDNESEDAEAFSVELSTPFGGATLGNPSGATVTIIDDDQPTNPGALRLSSSTYSGSESVGSILVSVQRTGGSDGPLAARLTTFDESRVGDATPGLDYQPVSVDLVWGDGDASAKSVAVSIIEDDEIEDEETFTIGLEDLSGEVTIVEPSLATISIIDNDVDNAVVSFTESSFRTGEGQASFFAGIMRSGDLGGEASIQFQTLGGSARNNEDFQVVSQRVNFSSGEQFKSVEVPILDDADVEGEETFQVQLLNPAGPLVLGAPNQVVVTIEDNDNPPPPGQLRFAQARFVAGEENGVVSLEVERVNGTAGALSAQVVTRDDSALAGQDYQSRTTRIQFADGEGGVKTFNINIIDDAVPEPAERFFVGMQDSTGHTDTAEVGILDNDRLHVRMASIGQIVQEGSDTEKRETTVRVEAVLTSAWDQQLQVPYRVRGIAKSGEDHTLQDGFFIFESGSLSAFIEFQVIDDNVAEPDENIEIVLFKRDVPVGVPKQHQVLIKDNDRGQGPQTRIVSPGPPPLDPFAVNSPITFTADVAGGNNDDYAYEWEAYTTNGELAFKWEGRSTDQVFEEAGHYRIVCFARSGSDEDLTPAQIRIVVETQRAPIITAFSPSEEVYYARRGERVDFSAATDPEEAKGEWFLTDNPDNRVEAKSFSRTFFRNGVFVIAFRASLGEAASTRSITVVVSERGTPPVGLAIASPQNGAAFKPGDPITFSGSVVSNTKKADFALGWVMSDGTRLKGAEGVHAFSKPGRVRVRLVGQDGAKNRLEEAITIRIIDPNLAPDLDINIPTDLALEPGEPVFLSALTKGARGYQPEDLNFFWDMGDGRVFRTPVPGKVSYAAEGVYTISLYAIVSETGVQTNVASRLVTVEASTPERFEPNDSPAEAAVLTPGRYGNQTLDDNSPVDVYQIEILSDGQRLTVELQITDKAIVEVLNSKLDVIATHMLAESGSFSVQGLSAGIYYLRIRPESAEALKRKAGLSYSIGVGVLNPALYLSDIQTNENFTTQVGVVNPSNAAVSAEVVGYDSEGNIIDSVALELPALGRSHQSIEELFGNNAPLVTWVQVDATRDLFGYSRTENRDQKEVYGVTASNRLSTELFVPHIASRTEQWYTEARVVNGASQASESKILMPEDSADLKLSKGFAKDSFDFLNRFGVLPEDELWATMKDTNGEATLAGNEIFGLLKDKRVIAGLQLADVRQDNPNFTFIGNNLYFTHIARNVGAFWTGIALVNIGESQQSVKIRAFGDDGVELNSKTLVLDAGTKYVDLAEGLLDGIGSPADVDWVLAEADLQIVGYELFGTHDGNRIAGLEASTALSKNLCYPFIDNNSDVVHGISVVNVTDTPVSATFTLYSDQGVALASVVKSLLGKEKYTITIEELFEGQNLDEIQVPGWLSVVADQPLAGFELFVNLANGEQMGALIAQ